ncbi:hypothetical protein BGZ76_011439 [Entomortierella beljakovae]|nr:hypothetical protein BGZ76_011439 [Entomortierella beljakovae]
MSSEVALWPPPSSPPPPPHQVESIPLSQQIPKDSETDSSTKITDHTEISIPNTSSPENTEAALQSKTAVQQQQPTPLSLDATLKNQETTTTGKTSGPVMNRVNITLDQPKSAQTSQSAERPTGIPRCIVRIDRDHNMGDSATRFECEQCPQEFIDRVTRQQFKMTVEGINKCMEVAEESLLNCLDTILDCLSAYTAKHCFGTHYQRSMQRMVDFIEQENRRIYHPAKMHLRDPQKVGMIYLEFEIF